jgi:polar amino acid transport system substrate-binding protein
MRTKNFLKIWILCLVTLFFSIEVFAQTLTVVFKEWPPYQFTFNGKVVGTDTEILEEVGLKLGITFQFKSMPWARALKEVQDGAVDAIFSLGKTKERAKFLYYPGTPINTMRIVFLH